MKKLRMILATCLGAVALAGCSLFGGGGGKETDKGGDSSQQEYEYNPTITGGTEAEQNAILDTLNNKPICNQSGSSTNEIFPENTPILSEDNGDGVQLTINQKIGDLTVELEWEVPEQTYFKALLDSDAAHKIIEVAYKGYGVADGTLNWSLKKMKCGGAVAEPTTHAYHATIQNEKFFHGDATIAQIYAFTEHNPPKDVNAGGTHHYFPSTWDNVDYEYDSTKTTYSPYFKTNNEEATEKQYLYLNVLGKVIYTAPDGNWGLLADGDNILEFYAGSGKALTEKNWPNLAEKYVKISGNMGQYCGNVQFGFITKIAAATAAEKQQITEPSLNYRELTEAKIKSLKAEGFTSQTQAIKVDDVVLEGSLRQVTGTLIADSIKMKVGDNMEPATAATIESGKRITFDLQVGSEKLTVAYDYHSDKTATVGLFNAIKAKLQGGAGTSITVKGTMRYSGNNSAPFVYEGNNGVWNIVPFEVGHIA